MAKATRQIILHIGGEKTGTTSLQRFLFRNRELMKKRGMLFPITLGSENHMLLAVYASPNEDTADLRAMLNLTSDEMLDRTCAELPQMLHDEIRQSQCQTVILSNEHCSSRLRKDESVARLFQLLDPIADNLRVIMYLRRQDQLLLSSYSTSVKSGNTQELRLPTKNEYCHFDYANILDRWAKYFGVDNIDVRIYEPEALKDNDIVSDFIQALELPISTVDFRKESQRLNRTLDFRTLEFLRLFNKHVPYIASGVINPKRVGLLPLLEELSINGQIELDSEQLQSFLRSFDETNAYVARKYLKRDDAQLFSYRKFAATSKSKSFLDAESAVEIAAQLWVRGIKSK